MNFKACYRHPMNRLALGFFIAALVCFGVFHSRPYSMNGRGWTIWVELFKFFSNQPWKKTGSWTVVGAFLGTSMLVIAGPIATPFVCWHKLSYRVLECLSLATLVGFWWYVGTRIFVYPLLWIAASQGFHFVGCLCIRRPKPEEFVPAPHLDG